MIIKPAKPRDTGTRVMSSTIRKEFGKILKKERIKIGMTREKLAGCLDIDPGTILSWEMGRSFIKDLSLIIDLQIVSEIYIPNILDEAVKNVMFRRKFIKKL